MFEGRPRYCPVCGWINDHENLRSDYNRTVYRYRNDPKDMARTIVFDCNEWRSYDDISHRLTCFNHWKEFDDTFKSKVNIIVDRVLDIIHDADTDISLLREKTDPLVWAMVTGRDDRCSYWTTFNSVSDEVMKE